MRKEFLRLEFTDSTNLFTSPAVTAVAPLGYDHMEVLGNSLTEIAFEESGICKVKQLVCQSNWQEGIPALTVENHPAEALSGLFKTAVAQKGV